MKTVAIHQANFFPWLPFFHKLAVADHFILLDDVQYERTGAGSWQNRVRLAFQGQPYWLTCPLDRSIPKTAKIMEMRLHADYSWKRKAIGTLQNHYRKAAFFKEMFPLIKGLIEYESDNLALYNQHTISSLSEMLGITTPITCSSTLDISTSGTQRLIDLVKAIDGTQYYAGRNAAQTYQDNDAFANQGLELAIENYGTPAYAQANCPDFVSGLSIIDALMHIGTTETYELLHLSAEITKSTNTLANATPV